MRKAMNMNTADTRAMTKTSAANVTGRIEPLMKNTTAITVRSDSIVLMINNAFFLFITLFL